MKIKDMYCPNCSDLLVKNYRKMNIQVDGEWRWVECLNALVCYKCDSVFQRNEYGHWGDVGSILANMHNLV